VQYRKTTRKITKLLSSKYLSRLSLFFSTLFFCKVYKTWFYKAKKKGFAYSQSSQKKGSTH
jgi:hypothetical protein